MPLQRSYVEACLDRFCAPGTHHFRVRGGKDVVCESCGKVELAKGGTCLFCKGAGEYPLTMLFRGAIQFPGRLCGQCLAEFEEREIIRGWYIEKAG